MIKSISFKNDLKKSEATKIYMILPQSIVIVLICTAIYKAIFKCKLSSFDRMGGCQLHLGGVSGPSQWVEGVGHTPCVDGIFKLSLKCANSILKLSVMLIFGVILDLEGVANKWVWLKRKFWYVSLYALNRLYQILTFFVNKIPGQIHVNFCCLTFFQVILKWNGL